MKKIVVSIFLLFVILLSCTNRDGEIIDLINSVKKQNDDLKAQITSLKKTTDSAMVAITKVTVSQAVTDKKLDAIQTELKSVLAQISSLTTQMTAANADLASIKAKIDALQVKCAELVAQIAALNSANAVYTLSVDVSPLNSGQIQISPLADSYKSGTEVTISLSPSPNFAFKQWIGDASGTTLPLKVIINGNKKITALFEQKATNTLNLVISGEGSVKIVTSTINKTLTKPGGTLEIEKGAKVNLSAISNSGYFFEKWSNGINDLNTTVDFVMNTDNNITSSFKLIPTNSNSKIDIDGNSFNTVAIGNQVWMKENLNVTRYQNGDLIPNVRGNEEWAALKTGAWCRYNNDLNASNSTKTGLLYNAFVAQDPRNACPIGYSIPTDSDFQELINFLGGASITGGKMKEANGTLSLWNNPNYGATNSSGFTALPSGYRHASSPGNWINGLYEWALLNAYYWTKTTSIGGGTITFQLSYNDALLNRVINNNHGGQSIRCIKN